MGADAAPQDRETALQMAIHLERATVVRTLREAAAQHQVSGSSEGGGGGPGVSLDDGAFAGM